MNKIRLFIVIAAGTLAGFCIGIALTVQIAAGNDYVRYRLYRLILLGLQEYLNAWVLACLSVMLCGGLVCWLLLRLAERALPGNHATRVWTCAGLTLLVSISLAARFAPLHERLPWYAGLLLMALFYGWLFAYQPKDSVRGRAQRMTLVLLAVLLCLNLGMLIDARVSRPAGPNIVLIVVDCLRPDHMGRSGYPRDTTPALDALSRSGIVFTRAYANAPWTKPSIATMFTSLYPNAHGVTSGYSVMPEKALTLAEILRGSGYRTLFFNSGNEFIDRAYGFCQGFDSYVYHPAGRTDAGLITRDFISRISAAGKQRFFAYLHYMDAHTPYTANDSKFIFTAARIKDFEPGNRRGSFKYVRLMTSQQQIGTAEQEYITALYDAQIRSIDQHIQKVLQALQAAGVLQNTVLMITSDHGEEFWDHGNFEHGHTLYNELLHVPLLINGPGLAPAEVSAPVRLIDMAPTVLELAQVTAPSAMIQQGVSLLPLLQGSSQLKDLPVFATGILYGPEKYCLIKDNRKLILNTDQKKNKWNLIGHRYEGPAEYYDLHSDPRERTNTLNSENQSMLQEELSRFRDMPSLFGTRQLAGPLQKDVREKLEALGYVQ